MKGHNYGEVCLKCGRAHVHPRGMLGVGHTEVTRLRMSASRSGRPKTPEWGEKIAFSNVGKNLKNGRYNHKGYWYVLLLPDTPFYLMASSAVSRTGGYVLEHRLFMARHLGRCLHSWEIVHHINGDRGDNNLDNLQLLPDSSSHLVDTVLKSRMKTLERENLRLKQQLIKYRGY